jgi:glyoxylase I family protein
MIKINKFRHVAIIVKDLDKMVDFYTKVMGFNVKRMIEIESEDFRKGISIPNAKAKVAHLTHPDLAMELELFEFYNNQNDNPNPDISNMPGYRHIAFIVEDLEQCYKTLKDNNIEFFSEPITVKEPASVAGFKFVYFKDPEGNIIELNQLPESEIKSIKNFNVAEF